MDQPRGSASGRPGPTLRTVKNHGRLILSDLAARTGRAAPTALRAERTDAMCPDWANEEEDDGGKPHAHRPAESDLPIIDPDEDEDFDEDEEDEDEEFETEESLEVEIDSEPRTVLITGAC